MDAPYRSPGARPKELRPLDPAEEWRLLADGTSRPPWPQLLIITAYTLFGAGSALAGLLYPESATTNWTLVLVSLYFTVPALSVLATWLRYRRRRRRLEAEGYDLGGANEVLGVAAARAAETLQQTADRVVRETARRG